MLTGYKWYRHVLGNFTAPTCLVESESDKGSAFIYIPRTIQN